MSMKERILIDPSICQGRPVIAGTRITVQTILEFLGAGDSIEEVLEERPSLSRQDILACFESSALLLGNPFSAKTIT